MSKLPDSKVDNIGRGMDLSEIFSSVSGQTVFNQDIERIKQSLDVIFSTFFDEVPMIPVLGSNLPYLVYEPLDSGTVSLAKTYATEAINKLEPRMALENLQVDLDMDNHMMTIKGSYKLTNTNIVGEFDHTLDFERGEG